MVLQLPTVIAPVSDSPARTARHPSGTRFTAHPSSSPVAKILPPATFDKIQTGVNCGIIRCNSPNRGQSATDPDPSFARFRWRSRDSSTRVSSSTASDLNRKIYGTIETWPRVIATLDRIDHLSRIGNQSILDRRAVGPHNAMSLSIVCWIIALVFRPSLELKSISRYAAIKAAYSGPSFSVNSLIC